VVVGVVGSPLFYAFALWLSEVLSNSYVAFGVLCIALMYTGHVDFACLL